MTAAGEIQLSLRAEGPGPTGDALLSYPKGHPRYDALLKHLGGLAPGQTKDVPPWDPGADR